MRINSLSWAIEQQQRVSDFRTLIYSPSHAHVVLPLGHLTFAYLWYVFYAAARSRQLPARLVLVPLAFGSQFPDLIDKPLAYLGVLTYGRSLAHSLFAFLICTAVVWWGAAQLRNRWSTETIAERLRSITPAAFAIGYASHLVGDTYRFFLAGDFWTARFLLYPLFPVPESPADEVAPWIRLFEIYQEMGSHPQVGIIALASVVFLSLRIHRYWHSRQLQRV